MKKISFLFLFLLLLGRSGVLAQYSLATSPYTQNFDGLGTATSASVTGGSLNNVSATLNGWYFSELLSSANTTITAGTGSSTTGDTYNFGVAANADRTLGGLRSSTLNPYLGFYFTNNTGSDIEALQVTYTGKTWRRGADNRVDRLDFQYSNNATTLTTGTWTNVDALDYATPVVLATGSGTVQHSAVINNYILDITIPDGANFFIRWTDFDATGSDDGMGIDDLTLTVTDPTIINYYSKSSGNLTSTATWGTNSNGTGTTPPNFTNPFQNFYVTNRTTATLDANWSVSGALSKVITGDGSSATTLIIPSSAALTGIVDVADQATLRLENATLPTVGTIEDGSTINFAQSTNYEIPAGGIYHNLTVTGGTKTIATGNTTVTGNIVLDAVNFTGSGVSIAVIELTGNFTLQNGATLGATGIRPGLVMNGSGTQTLSGGDFRLNYLETDDQSGALTIALSNANLSLNGDGLDLQIATDRLSLNGNTLALQGYASLAALGEGLGSITGSSTSNITIDRSSGPPVGILRMTAGGQALGSLSLRDVSSGGPLELGSPLSISTNLNFLVSGRIITTATNLLTVQQGATITGGGPNTYVEGPLARVTNAVGDYLFPIGELGSSDGRFIVVKIETPGNTSTFRAQYFETGVNTNGPSCDFNVTGTYGVNGYKINEHYNISRTSGTSPAKITFDFDGSNLNNNDWSNNVAPGTSDGVVMAHYNTTFSCWEVASSQILLYPPSGNITTDLLTSFSPFTFGYIGVSSLPVKFGNVRAYQQGNGIKIDWSNLTESSVVDYKVERSANGRDFTSLSALTAIKNDGNRADYSFVDAAPVNGVNYYRIQSLELDGKKLYSVIVKVDIKGTKGVITLYPNPVTDGQMVVQTPDLKRGSYNLTVVNAVGQQVYSKALSHAGGFVTQSIQLPASLKPGIYNLQMVGDGVKLTKTFIVQ
jgi:hypothetical protein